MPRRERLGLTFLAGGVGLAIVNLLSWLSGLSIGTWRPATSGILMATGIALLAIEVIRATRQPNE